MRVKIINSTGRVEDTQAIDMDTGVELPVVLVKLEPLLHPRGWGIALEPEADAGVQETSER